MVSVEQRQLLPAVGAVLGVIDVEHQPARRLGEAVAEQRDHRRHHALERDPAGQVLQPGHGRLRAQVDAALGQSAHRHLEGRVPAQGVAVVGVRIARRDRQGPEPNHLGQTVDHPIRRPRVLKAAGQPVGDTEPVLDLRQQQHAAIRGKATAIKPGFHGLAADR